MTTHDRDKVIAAAKLCGYWNGQTIEMNDVGIERFYTIAHEDGRQAEREECINVIWSHYSLGPEAIETTIRTRSTK